MSATNPFHGNLAPAPIEGALRMDGFIIWGASVIQGDDDRYYMFASRWPSAAGMRNWVVNSEIVLASADVPEGPFAFEKVVLPPRGKAYWDGMMTHNPTIHRHAGKYVLFYIGATYDFERPSAPVSKDTYGHVWNRKRIGVAVSDAPHGPWKRLDQPILQPRPESWDAAITSNPAVVLHDDGSVFLVYKSAPVPYPQRNQNRALYFGVARAAHYLGPYERANAGERIQFAGLDSVEDPYIWYSKNTYHMVAKVFDDSLTGENDAGFHATSADGIHWHLSSPPKAYSRNVLFADGISRTQAKLERPQILLHDGRPTHIFFATADDDAARSSQGLWADWQNIYNLVIPLQSR